MGVTEDRSANADSDELAEFGYEPGARPDAGELPHVRGRDQLHLDPHRHLPALLLRLRARRPGVLVVVADGLRRPAHGRAVLLRARRRAIPVAGSIYNWSKRLSTPHVAWLAGWMMLTASIVTVAAVALAYQITLPQISTSSSSTATAPASTTPPSTR